MQFEDIVEDCIMVAGSGNGLADMLGVSPSEVTRIRSGEGKLSLKTINKMLEITGLEINQIGQVENIKTALKIITDLWKEADNKSG